MEKMENSIVFNFSFLNTNIYYSHSRILYSYVQIRQYLERYKCECYFFPLYAPLGVIIKE